MSLCKHCFFAFVAQILTSDAHFQLIVFLLNMQKKVYKSADSLRKQIVHKMNG